MRKKIIWWTTALFVFWWTGIAAASPQLPVKYGMRGENVSVVQKMLAGAGFYFAEIDGIFGTQTLQAVKHFQAESKLEPDGVVEKVTYAYLERAKPAASRHGRAMAMAASAYSAYDPGNGSRTSRGNLLRKGLVAVDPAVIPLGTRLFIPGYGYAVADDTGGAIKGNRIDLAFDSHWEAVQFGRQCVTVYILD